MPVFASYRNRDQTENHAGATGDTKSCDGRSLIRHEEAGGFGRRPDTAQSMVD